MAPKKPAHPYDHKYPEPQEVARRKRKLFFLCGVVVAVIVAGWVVSWPYVFSSKEGDRNSHWQEITTETTGLLQMLRDGVAKTLGQIETFSQQLENSNQTPAANQNSSENNLSEEQIEQFEEDVFPQFENQ